MSEEAGTSPDRRGRGAVLIVVGVALCVVATVLAVTRVTDLGYDCGSVLAPSSYGGSVSGFLVDSHCEDARSARTWGVVAAAVIGIATLIIGARYIARSPRAASGPARPSVSEDLSRLAQLHGAGSITDDEYAAAKARILERTD